MPQAALSPFPAATSSKRNHLFLVLAAALLRADERWTSPLSAPLTSPPNLSIGNDFSTVARDDCLSPHFHCDEDRPSTAAPGGSLRRNPLCFWMAASPFPAAMPTSGSPCSFPPPETPSLRPSTFPPKPASVRPVDIFPESGFPLSPDIGDADGSLTGARPAPPPALTFLPCLSPL